MTLSCVMHLSHHRNRGWSLLRVDLSLSNLTQSIFCTCLFHANIFFHIRATLEYIFYARAWMATILKIIFHILCIYFSFFVYSPQFTGMNLKMLIKTVLFYCSEPLHPDSDSMKMFVGQIPKCWTEFECRQLLEPYGQIYALNILKDKDSKKSKG